MIRRPLTAVTLALAAGLVLSGCGFRPLYGDYAPGVSAHEELSRIRLNTRNDRVDYLVRTNLIDRLHTTRASAEPKYELRVRLRDEREGVAVERDASITRFNYQLVAVYELTDIETNEVMFNGKSRSVAAYNVVDNQFATLSAQRDAEERAAQDIADDVKIRIAIFFDRAERDRQSTN